MSFDSENQQRLLTCPYDSAHSVMACRMIIHLEKCSRNHSEKSKNMGKCTYNSTHIVPLLELPTHHELCPDRAAFDHYIRRIERPTALGGSDAQPFTKIDVKSSGEWDTEPPMRDNDPTTIRNEFESNLNSSTIASTSGRGEYLYEERPRIEQLEEDRRINQSSHPSRSGGPLKSRGRGLFFHKSLHGHNETPYDVGRGMRYNSTGRWRGVSSLGRGAQ